MSWKRQKGDGLHVHELRIQRRQWFLRYDTCIGLAYTPRKYHEAPTYVRITERRCVMCMDRDLQRRTDVLVINVARSEARTCPTSAAWPRPHSRLHGLKTHLFKRAYIMTFTSENYGGVNLLTYLLCFTPAPNSKRPKRPKACDHQRRIPLAHETKQTRISYRWQIARRSVKVTRRFYRSCMIYY